MKGLKDRYEAPARQKRRDLTRQTLHTCLRNRNRIDVIQKNDLLRWMREAHYCEPAPVCTCPAPRSNKNTTVAKKEALKKLGAFPATRIAVARARTRSRIASCAASGT